MIADRVFVKDVIRSRRLALGLSQAALAKAVGLQSAEHISMIENGHRTLPLSKAPAIADALRVDQLDFCRLVLFERFPEFYAVMFGAVCPPSPRVLNPRS